jgi:hypothetical protein
MASNRDLDTLTIPAVRYALGRRTYVVADICEIVAYNAANLRAETKAIICRDIDEAEARDGLGDPDIDAPCWRDLRALLAADHYAEQAEARRVLQEAP